MAINGFYRAVRYLYTYTHSYNTHPLVHNYDPRPILSQLLSNLSEIRAELLHTCAVALTSGKINVYLKWVIYVEEI